MFMKSSCTPVGALDLARKIAARIHKESWIGLAIFGVVLSFLPLIWTFYTAISG